MKNNITQEQGKEELNVKEIKDLKDELGVILYKLERGGMNHFSKKNYEEWKERIEEEIKEKTMNILY